MAVTVRLPGPLQRFTSGLDEVTVEGSTVGEVLDKLEAEYQGIKRRLCEEDGSLRRFINIFLNEQDIRFLDGLETKLSDGDELSIIPAIAGG